MKKNLCTVVAIMAAVCLSFKMIAVNTTGITVANGMLVFDTKETYTNLIANSTPGDQLEFATFSLAQADFNSLLETKEVNVDLYNYVDDFFASIINDRAYVQIGSYIYKLSPTNDKVLVFPSTHPELIAIIDGGDRTSTFIIKHSMEDDVIGMVESGTPPANSRLFCGESGCDKDDKEGIINIKTPAPQEACGTFYGRVRYIRGGIYFKLYAECQNTCATRRMYYHKTPVAFKVKCGNTTGPQYQWDNDNGYNGGPSNKWNSTYYLNIQPLNGFWLRIVFMAKDANWIGNPDNPSLDLEIRRNM
jgi:hypothetical protein